MSASASPTYARGDASFEARQTDRDIAIGLQVMQPKIHVLGLAAQCVDDDEDVVRMAERMWAFVDVVDAE